MHPNKINWLSAYKDIVKTPHGDLTDFTSGILVANLGHNNNKLSKELSQAISGGNPNLFCYHYDNDVIKIAKKNIIDFCGRSFQNVYMCCTGSESTEAAIRVANLRKSKNDKYPYVIGFESSYHGRTFAPALSTGLLGSKFQSQNIVTLPALDSYTDKEELRECIKEEICSNKGVFAGIIIEAFRGWDSHFWNKEYILQASDLCDKNGALLIFDEMQSGFYRTGKKFAYEHYNIIPDVLCIGKALGNGVPVSATVFGAKINDTTIQRNLSSTFQSHTLGCIASKFVTETMNTEEFHNILKINIEIFNHSLDKLLNISGIQVNKNGLVASIIFSKKNQAEEMAAKILKEKILVIDTGKNALKLAPPLNSDSENLKLGIDIIVKTIISNIKLG